MVRVTHTSTHWTHRCIMDSSDEENTPPNVLAQQEKDCSKDDDAGSTGSTTPSWFQTAHPSQTSTETPPWTSPERVKIRSKTAASPHRTLDEEPSPLHQHVAIPTTSSPVLLEAPTRFAKTRHPRKTDRQDARQELREAAAPYSRPHPVQKRSFVKTLAPVRTVLEEPSRPRTEMAQSDDVFVPAGWPYGIINLRDHFNPLATIFPKVPHFGSCGCWNPCRATTCRNARVNVYCNINGCPYEGKCGNGLDESTKVLLGRNTRTNRLGVVAAEDIRAGEVLGQYLGEIEHVTVSRAGRPRNGGYRLVLRQRPEKPSYTICAAINAERMGSLMRFVNHSCKPVAQFVEVTNGRRTTVVVQTTNDIRRGQEVTVDYGDDLWFVCRCKLEGCVHGDIQGDDDP